MRSRAKVCAGLILLLMVAFIVWRIPDKEPSWRGHALSYSVEELVRSHIELFAAKGRSELWREFGGRSWPVLPGSELEGLNSNAAPLLVNWVGYQPSAWRERLTAWHDHESTGLARWIPESLTCHGALFRAEGSCSVLEALGPQGWPAIPKLAHMAISTNQALAQRSVLLLRSIGPAALTALKGIVRNASASTRQEALEAICALDADAEDVMPILLECFQQPGLRRGALNGIRGLGARARPAIPALVARLKEDPDDLEMIEVLSDLALEPELSVPALTNSLQSRITLVEMKAAISLGHFGRGAKAALPALTNVAADSDPLMRWAATNSIRAITEEVSSNEARSF
jgi:HEAT repeats